MLLQEKPGVSMTLNKMLRALILGLALLVCTTPASQPTASCDDALTLLPRETRLRKLHLVRPDLIHYPLSVEVIC